LQYFSPFGHQRDNDHGRKRPPPPFQEERFDYRSPSLSLLKVTLNKNTAAASGGAIFLNQSKTAMYAATLSANRAESGNGGAIYGAAQTVLAIDESKFVQNYAKGSGGAIWVTKTGLYVTHTPFERNTANGKGGAIFDEEKSIVVMSQCDFSYNTAPYSDGGAINLD
jgi:predicted outer membrane repeat protein